VTTVGEYRLDPLDRALIGPLTRRQVVILGSGALLWLLAVVAGKGFLVGLVAVAVACVVAVPSFGGQTLADWLPVWCGWTFRGRRGHRWLRPLHLTTGAGRCDTPPLPPWLGGLRILAHPTAGWATIHDQQAKTLTAHLQIAGTGFTTLASDQMDFLLSAWGAVFGAVPVDDGVVRITWSDIARRMPLVGHDEWVAARRSADADLDEYRAFVADELPMRHDLVLTVTLRSGPLRTAVAESDALDRVAAAVGILKDALKEARLVAHGPLAAGEIAYLTRAGLSPTAVEPAGGRRAGSLVQRLGLVPVADAGPMCTDVTSGHVAVDDVVHRCFWVSGWPERPQRGDWFEPLLARDAPDAVQRVFTVIAEPLDDHKALAEIRHAASRHGGEQVAAAEGRTRWDHFKARKARAVDQREHELASGHTPVAYAGLVTVTVADVDQLPRAARAVIRRHRRDRVFLQPLWGRMELGLAAGLPLGLGLSREPF
jgi:hypothetical protein